VPMARPGRAGPSGRGVVRVRLVGRKLGTFLTTLTYQVGRSPRVPLRRSKPYALPNGEVRLEGHAGERVLFWASYELSRRG